MTLTPEQFQSLLQALGTQSGAHNSVLVFSGIIALAGMLSVVWFVLNMRLKPVDKLQARMDEMQKMLSQLDAKMWALDAKMWSPEALDLRIDSRINTYMRQHQRQCPVRSTKA